MALQPNALQTALGGVGDNPLYSQPEPTANPGQPTAETNPNEFAAAKSYSTASPTQSSYTDPAVFQTAINQMRTKMESNNKLINAKNAVFKHMYDQPLTDDEKAALTPGLANAISSGNRNLIDAAIQDVTAQIKGYNQTIDTNLAAYSEAVNKANALKQDIGKTVLDYTSKGVDGGSIAGYIQSMGMSPEEFGLNGNLSIPEGTLAARNNNPGNLRYVGQAGASQGEGGFARFDTPEAGYAALQNQIALDASRGETLSQFINKYAPSSENNTSLYLQQAQAALGVSSSTPIAEIDINKLSQFIANKESGTKVNYETAGGKSDIEINAGMLASGELPPSLLPAYGSMRAKAEAEAKRIDPNFSPAKAELQYQAAKRWTMSMNSTQTIKFQGLAGSVVNTIDEVKNLADQMQLSGVPVMNKVELEAYIQTQGNSPQGQVAAQYLAAVNTLKEEFANLANGGYAPTEAAWALANSQINANYGVDQLGASLSEVQRLINYRINAIGSVQSVYPGSDNFGVSSQSSNNNDPLGIL